MNSDLRPVHALLARLRARIRRVWATRGAGILLTAVSVAAVLSFTLDVLLDLPVAVRAVHLAAVCCILVVTAWRTLVAPLRVPVDETELAQAVEHGAPWLADRLASSLDFETRLDDPTEPESRELMAAVIRDAAAAAAKVRVEDVVDGRSGRRAMAAGAAAAACLLAVGIAFADDFGMWVRRGILLQDLEWPRRTTVHVLDFPEDRPLVLTRGDDLRIVAQVEGKVPEELEFHYRELSSGDGREGEDGEPQVVFRDLRKMYPVEAQDGRFTMDLRSVAAPFRFWVTGGDDRDERPLYVVDVVIPPRIASISAQITYPDYSGLAAEVKELPAVEALEGSRIEYDLSTNMPLASARLIPAADRAGTKRLRLEPRDLQVVGEGRDRIAFTLQVTGSTSFHLALTASDGHTNRDDDDVFHLVAVKDRPPTVRILYPQTRRYRTPNGVVPVKAVVSDDFGLGSVDLELTRDEGTTTSLRVWTAPPGAADDDPNTGPANTSPADKTAEIYSSVDLVTLVGNGADGGPEGTGGAAPLAPGDRLHIVVRARDSTGRESRSDESVIEIISREDLENRLRQDQIRLREALRRLAGAQFRTLTGLKGLEVALVDQPPDGGALDRGRDLQVAQGRVTNELGQFISGVHRMMDAYVLNRLGNTPTLDKLLPIYDEHLSLPTASDTGVFGPALYQKMLEEKRDDRLFDPDVVGTLLEIMDMGDVAITRICPTVYDSLRGWGDDATHPKASLTKAREAAEELEDLLRRIDDRMRRWEALSEIVILINTIKRTEDDLSKPIPVNTDDGR